MAEGNIPAGASKTPKVGGHRARTQKTTSVPPTQQKPTKAKKQARSAGPTEAQKKANAAKAATHTGPQAEAESSPPRNGLKGDEGALIAAAVAGKPLEDIAQIADVSVSTVQRRLRDAEIAAAIREGRADHQRQAVGQLNEDLSDAITRLRDLVGHDDPAIALRAIDKLIAHAHRFNRALDIAVTNQPGDDQAGAA